MGKKVLKCLAGFLIALVVLLAGYVAYVCISYYRLEDHLELTADAPLESAGESESIQPGETYTIITANLGFGAYDQDYDFFMDGGTKSWGDSKAVVQEDICSQCKAVHDEDPDFVFLQEIDTNSTRSYHVNEYDLCKEEFSGFSSVFAQNYDSPFLFWPLYQPHGKSVSGMVTLYDKGEFLSSERRSLPISQSLSKFLDLDRCYSITRLSVSDGHELVLINLHLSAYGVDESIQEAQKEMLYEDMKAERDAGNYVIVGGDFNHDMTGDSAERFGNASAEDESWARAFDFDSVPEGFTVATKEAMAEGIFDGVPTCRDAGLPWDGTGDCYVLDTFIYSDNIEMTGYSTLDMDFLYSDHNPVKLSFKLM